MLVSYGAYGMPVERSWCPRNEILLAEGWTIAYAHIRGGASACYSCAIVCIHAHEPQLAAAGGDLGKQWHLAAVGAGLPKRLADLQACLHELQRQLNLLGSSPQIVLHATSAGGIAAGALLNTQPVVRGSAAGGTVSSWSCAHVVKFNS